MKSDMLKRLTSIILSMILILHTYQISADVLPIREFYDESVNIEYLGEDIFYISNDVSPSIIETIVFERNRPMQMTILDTEKNSIEEIDLRLLDAISIKMFFQKPVYIRIFLLEERRTMRLSLEKN